MRVCIYYTSWLRVLFLSGGGWGGSFFSWLLPLLIVRAEGVPPSPPNEWGSKGDRGRKGHNGQLRPKAGGGRGGTEGFKAPQRAGGGQSRNPSSQSRSGAVLSPPLKVLELSWEDGQTPTLGGWEGGERRREPKTQPGVPQNPELTALGRCAPQDGDGDGVGLGDGGGGGCPRLSDAPTWGLHCTSGPGSAERTRRWRGVRVGVGAATRSASG